MPKGKRWTKEDDALLLRLREEGASYGEIAAELGRSRHSVETRCCNVRKPRAASPILGALGTAAPPGMFNEQACVGMFNGGRRVLKCRDCRHQQLHQKFINSPWAVPIGAYRPPRLCPRMKKLRQPHRQTCLKYIET